MLTIFDWGVPKPGTDTSSITTTLRRQQGWKTLVATAKQRISHRQNASGYRVLLENPVDISNRAQLVRDSLKPSGHLSSVSCQLCEYAPIHIRLRPIGHISQQSGPDHLVTNTTVVFYNWESYPRPASTELLNLRNSAHQTAEPCTRYQ